MTLSLCFLQYLAVCFIIFRIITMWWRVVGLVCGSFDRHWCVYTMCAYVYTLSIQGKPENRRVCVRSDDLHTLSHYSRANSEFSQIRCLYCLVLCFKYIPARSHWNVNTKETAKDALSVCAINTMECIKATKLVSTKNLHSLFLCGDDWFTVSAAAAALFDLRWKCAGMMTILTNIIKLLLS